MLCSKSVKTGCFTITHIRNSRIDQLDIEFPKKILYGWFYDFQSLKVSQGEIRTLNRWGGKINHLLMAYLLSNICTNSYWNRTTAVKLSLVVGWVYFFEAQCTSTGTFFLTRVNWRFVKCIDLWYITVSFWPSFKLLHTPSLSQYYYYKTSKIPSWPA